MKHHVLRVSDLSDVEIARILDRAAELREGDKPRRFPDAVVGLLFLQASTRTRLGFHAAVARLDGRALTLQTPKYQLGMSHPESLEDTLSSIAGYCDTFILRHEAEDAVDRAAAVLRDKWLVNGGNGRDEHPTQALIDLFAIRTWHGMVRGLRLGIVGDLRRSRAAHSLLQVLRSVEPHEVRLMYPAGHGVGSEYLRGFPANVLVESNELSVEDLDVLYIAGLPEGEAYDANDATVRSRLQLRMEHETRMLETCQVLCPLPRIDEIARTFDGSRHAGYFQQSQDGLFVRTALLESLWSDQST